MKDLKTEASTTNWSESFDSSIVELFKILGQGIFAIGIAIREVLRVACRHPVKTSLGTTAYFIGSQYVVKENLHLMAFRKICPDLFYELRNYGIFSGSDLYHFTLLSTVLAVPLLLIIGFMWMLRRAKEEKIFKLAKLKNAEDRYPKILKRTKNRSGSITMVIDPVGLGVSDFTSKKDQLEGLFKLGLIEEISRLKSDQAKIVIQFSKVILPKMFKYSSIDKTIVPRDHFIIGTTKDGLFAQDIGELPHMLIAGMTGSGKSVFFKQALLSLLESTPNIEMHLIDLKGGLEMSDFKDSSRVKLVSDAEKSVEVLENVKEEMLRRFEYLKKVGRKTIDPIKDNMPRIIVGIDECSVLYMKKNKGTTDYYNSIRAREITDDIAKLSRAAGIHLILATQKVTKETISTSIQDNIAAKVCFKMSGNNASILVLGNKKAEDLPQIQGRAIWHYGQEFVEFQAPYINEKEIKAFCKNDNEQKEIIPEKATRKESDEDLHENVEYDTSEGDDNEK